MTLVTKVNRARNRERDTVEDFRFDLALQKARF